MVFGLGKVEMTQHGNNTARPAQPATREPGNAKQNSIIGQLRSVRAACGPGGVNTCISGKCTCIYGQGGGCIPGISPNCKVAPRPQGAAY